MKHKQRIIFALIPLLLSSCAGQVSQGERQAEEPLRAVIFYHSQIWVQDINIMQQIAQGIQSGLTEDSPAVLSVYGTENLSTASAIETAIQMQADVVFASGSSSEAILSGFQNLKDNGVRLILVDGDLPESGRFAYIGTDNHASGIQSAQWMLQELGADAEIAVLAPDLNTTLRSVGARLEGFREEAECQNLQVRAYCETSYDSLTAIQNIENLLDTHPEIEALYCAEAVSGQAAADVVGERGLEDEITVICYDINEQIRTDLLNGTLDLTWLQDTEAIGHACADALTELAQNRGSQTGHDVLFDCIPITRENLEEVP